jgi:NitT/TauT family transport system substrate-binding protein
VKLQAFYNLVPGFFQPPAVAADSPIQTAKDFKGKRIGVQSLTSGGVTNIRAISAEAGLDPDKDLQFIPVGVGTQAAVAMFESKQIDVLSLWDGQYAAIENTNANYKLRTISSPLTERLGFNITVMALDEQLKTRREVFVKIGRGLAKATVFALANPEAAVQLHWRLYPETKAQAGTEQEALQKSVRVLTGRVRNMDIAGRQPPRTKWGFTPHEEVKTYYDVLVAPSGRVKGEVPLEAVYTNALIDEINKFDVAAVQAQAKSWKP